MDELRMKSKTALSHIFNNQKNIIIFEKNIYDSSLKNLKKYENFEDIYLYNIYQFIYDFKQKNNPKELLEEIKAGKIHWQNNYFNVMIDNEIEQDNFLIRPIEIEEGVLECKKCNSKRVFSYAKQSRSADESTSTFAECVACKYKWVNS